MRLARDAQLAKVGAGRPHAGRRGRLARRSPRALGMTTTKTCGWCGKSEADGVQLVAGPITNICARCCRLAAAALRIIPPENGIRADHRAAHVERRRQAAQSVARHRGRGAGSNRKHNPGDGPNAARGKTASACRGGRHACGRAEEVTRMAGGGRPMAGGGRPMAGGGRPMVGGAWPHAGGGRPHAGDGRPMAGGAWPHAGGARPHAGDGRSMAGGAWPHAGGARPHAGDGRPMAGGAWPHAGGARPHVGGARPQAGDAWPHARGVRPRPDTPGPGRRRVASCRRCAAHGRGRVAPCQRRPAPGRRRVAPCRRRVAPCRRRVASCRRRAAHGYRRDTSRRVMARGVLPAPVTHRSAAARHAATVPKGAVTTVSACPARYARSAACASRETLR